MIKIQCRLVIYPVVAITARSEEVVFEILVFLDGLSVGFPPSFFLKHAI